MVRPIFHEMIISIAKPYIRRELPGWGWVYRILVGSYTRDWFWKGARPRITRSKVHKFEMCLDISKWSDRSAFFLDRWYDLAAQLLISEVIRHGDTIIDIGANRGMFALTAPYFAGTTGKVICFEPNPAPLAIFRDDVKRNKISNIEIHEYGLSDAECVLTLAVPQINSGEASFVVNDYVNSDHIEVAVKIGDDVTAKTNPILIKIDVEGFEERVLHGLKETISRVRPLIITEIIGEKLAASGSSLESIRNLLEPLGYSGKRMSLARKGIGYELLLSDNLIGPFFDVLWFAANTPASERIGNLLLRRASLPREETLSEP